VDEHVEAVGGEGGSGRAKPMPLVAPATAQRLP